MDCLDVAVGDRENAVVLDFFAGSGTTGHAVALLNRRDQKRRQCILITNNEVDESTARDLNERGLFVGDEDFMDRGIARSVTIPRMASAISGLDPQGKPVEGTYLDGHPIDTGLTENLVSFALAYEDPDAIEIGERFEDILPTLWLAAGAMGDPSQLYPEKADARWLMAEACRFAVLLDEDHFPSFVASIVPMEGITHVWLVTDSDAAFARMRLRLSPNLTVGMLYRDYLRNFRINTASAR
jgi:adenine-specific DNA-methyltransferase